MRRSSYRVGRKQDDAAAGTAATEANRPDAAVQGTLEQLRLADATIQAALINARDVLAQKTKLRNMAQHQHDSIVQFGDLTARLRAAGNSKDGNQEQSTLKAMIDQYQIQMDLRLSEIQCLEDHLLGSHQIGSKATLLTADKELLSSLRSQVQARNNDCRVFLHFLRKRFRALSDCIKRLGALEVNDAALAVQQVARDAGRQVDCINKSLSTTKAKVLLM